MSKGTSEIGICSNGRQSVNISLVMYHLGNFTKTPKRVRLTPKEALSFVKVFRAYYCTGDLLWTTNVDERVYDINPALWVVKAFYQLSVS